jgi:hypothetical protein
MRAARAGASASASAQSSVTCTGVLEGWSVAAYATPPDTVSSLASSRKRPPINRPAKLGWWGIVMA